METTTTQSGNTAAQTPLSGRKERLMASIASAPTLVEREVREFAREFPTPHVQRAVALCESGRLSWAEVHELFRRSLAQGLSTVA